MISNYLVVAWRQILKNKLYALINILGLMVGLSVFVFGWLLVDYESSHDTFYRNHERIFTVGTVFSPSAAADVGIGETDGIYTGYTPLIRADVPELEAVARTRSAEFLVSIEDNHYYESLRFADPALLRIFDFEYIAGDESALEDPSGILLTRSMSEKLFGTTSAVGKSLTLDHDLTLHVTAIIEDLPQNTHFNSSLLSEADLESVAHIDVLKRTIDFDADEDFGNLSMGDLTYLLAPPGRNTDWVQARVDGVFQAHAKDDQDDFIAQLKVRPIVEANTVIFDAIGMPVMVSLQILSFLVLVVAIVNYTNLATAQSLSRAREVGLRKTMGATRMQLLTQFMVESLCIVAIAMLFALALLEIMIPVFNNALDRVLTINYVSTLPFILLTVMGVGVLSGLYPAYLITRASPIDALTDGSRQKIGGGLFRSIMLGLQFTISIFMLAMVMVVFFQNKKVEDASNLYPRSQIIALQRLGIESIQARMETLRNELLAIPGVQNVSYSSQLPYHQSNSSFGVGPIRGDEDSAFLLMQILTDEHFLDTYEIPLLAGRKLTKEISEDTIREGVLAANVIVNEMAARKLGFSSPAAAIGGQFYDFPDTREPRAYTIVGVVPDQNIQGFHNQIKPMAFIHLPRQLQFGSIKIAGVSMNQTLAQMEAVWDRIIPDYPMQSEFLDETFAETFALYGATTRTLAGFAMVALTLSMIGLFGLAAFMAQSRTREIGIRKVMGASIPQLVRLLVWQFSKPVMWALLIALPLSYLASDVYLNFFAERITIQSGIVMLAGVIAVLFSWVIVALHALRVARSNPINALRYE